jgi:hypothetical protein
MDLKRPISAARGICQWDIMWYIPLCAEHISDQLCRWLRHWLWGTSLKRHWHWHSICMWHLFLQLPYPLLIFKSSYIFQSIYRLCCDCGCLYRNCDLKAPLHCKPFPSAEHLPLWGWLSDTFLNFVLWRNSYAICIKLKHVYISLRQFCNTHRFAIQTTTSYSQLYCENNTRYDNVKKKTRLKALDNTCIFHFYFYILVRKNITFFIMHMIGHVMVYRPVAKQRPRNWQVQLLLCNRRINKHRFLSNGLWTRSRGNDVVNR